MQLTFLHFHSPEFFLHLQLDPSDKTGVKYIITTCMDPWSTSTDFIDELAAVMRNAILCAIGSVGLFASLS